MAAPRPSKGLITGVTLSGFCRATEKKHSVHAATPRKDFQFHSEVTCGTQRYVWALGSGLQTAHPTQVWCAESFSRREVKFALRRALQTQQRAPRMQQGGAVWEAGRQARLPGDPCHRGM